MRRLIYAAAVAAGALSTSAAKAAPVTFGGMQPCSVVTATEDEYWRNHASWVVGFWSGLTQSNPALAQVGATLQPSQIAEMVYTLCKANPGSSLQDAVNFVFNKAKQARE
jgi:hypothetical protein